MKQLTTNAVLILLAIASAGFIECQQRAPSATAQQKITALNDALKSGLITQDEYEAKVSAIEGQRAPSAVRSGQLQSFPIIDPVLQMPAWTLMAPANWNVEGTMLPGSSCVDGTSPLYRALSPDGFTGAYLLPRTDWAWGPAVRAGADCRPWAQQVSAKDFLDEFAHIRGLKPVRELPVPELDDARRNDFNRPGFSSHTDMARELVEYSINGHPTQEWLTVTVGCIDKAVMAVGQQHNCSAFVTRWFAPAGQLEALSPTFHAMRMTVNQQWMNEWTAKMVAGIQARSERETRALLQQGELAKAQRDQAHKAFMDNMEVERRRRNGEFQAHMYNKQQQNEDFIDYVLDCQRLYSGGNRLSVGGNCPNRQTW
jgi:hypothetical protein